MKGKTWNFITGQSQFGPKWIDKLPKWSFPVCIGDDYFQWFGIKIKTIRPLAGETLFMYWRRVVKIYKHAKYNYTVFQLGIHNFRIGHNGTLCTATDAYSCESYTAKSLWILGLFMQYDKSLEQEEPNEEQL